MAATHRHCTDINLAFFYRLILSNERVCVCFVKLTCLIDRCCLDERANMCFVHDHISFYWLVDDVFCQTTSIKSRCLKKKIFWTIAGR